MQYSVTVEQCVKFDKNDPKDFEDMPIRYEEWNSGPPGGFGRYTLMGLGLTNDRNTWCMPGEVCDEGDRFLIGLPPKDIFISVVIRKEDLNDAADFSSLKDKTQLTPLGIADITAEVITLI